MTDPKLIQNMLGVSELKELKHYILNHSIDTNKYPHLSRVKKWLETEMLAEIPALLKQRKN